MTVKKFHHAALQCDAKFSKSIPACFEISRILSLTTSVRIDVPNQVVRIGIVELIARAFVEHIRIDPVGSQQRDPLLTLGRSCFSRASSDVSAMIS